MGYNDWSALSWMILRGMGYALWIHFCVVLISKAGALINQYVSASRKLFSVLLSFLIFEKPFGFMHGVGFMCFAIACILKVSIAQKKEEQYAVNASDDECDGLIKGEEVDEQSDSELDDRKHQTNEHTHGISVL